MKNTPAIYLVLFIIIHLTTYSQSTTKPTQVDKIRNNADTIILERFTNGQVIRLHDKMAFQYKEGNLALGWMDTLKCFGRTWRLATDLYFRKEAKWGYLNLQNGKYIDATYDEFRPFYSGSPKKITTVKQNGYWAFIDESFNLLSGFQYKNTGQFYNESAWVIDSSSYFYYIDKKNKQITHKIYCAGKTGAVSNWPEITFDFDSTLTEGEIGTHDFKFYNKGDDVLLIKNCKVSCGCMCPSWSKDPIVPGDSAVIKIAFNSNGFAGREFHKSITVTTNEVEKGSNKTIFLFIKGRVSVNENNH